MTEEDHVISIKNSEYDVVTSIHFNEVVFTEASFRATCEAMKKLPTITTVVFSGTIHWPAEMIEILFATLKEMPNVELLTIDPRIPEYSYKPDDDPMVKMIRQNDHPFTKLRIREDSLFMRRLCAIADALKSNTKLLELSIAGAHVSSRVAEAFDEALTYNKTLQRLSFANAFVKNTEAYKSLRLKLVSNRHE